MQFENWMVKMGIFSISASKNAAVNVPQTGSRQKNTSSFKGFKVTSLIGAASHGIKNARSFASDKIAALRNFSLHHKWREGRFNSLVEVPVSQASLPERIDRIGLDSYSAAVGDESVSGSKGDKSTLFFAALSSKFNQLGKSQNPSNVENHTAELLKFIETLDEIYADDEGGWNPSNDQLKFLDGKIEKLRNRFPDELNMTPTNTKELEEIYQYKKNVSDYLAAVQALEDFVNT